MVKVVAEGGCRLLDRLMPTEGIASGLGSWFVLRRDQDKSASNSSPQASHHGVSGSAVTRIATCAVYKKLVCLCAQHFLGTAGVCLLIRFLREPGKRLK